MFVSEVQGLLMAMSDARGGDIRSRQTHHAPPLPLPPQLPDRDRLPSAEQRGKPPPPSYNRVKMSDIIMSDYRVSPEKRGQTHSGPATEAYLANHAQGRALAARAAASQAQQSLDRGDSPLARPPIDPRHVDDLTWEQLLPHAAATFTQASRRLPSAPQLQHQHQQAPQQLAPPPPQQQMQPTSQAAAAPAQWPEYQGRWESDVQQQGSAQASGHAASGHAASGHAASGHATGLLEPPSPMVTPSQGRDLFGAKDQRQPPGPAADRLAQLNHTAPSADQTGPWAKEEPMGAPTAIEVKGPPQAAPAAGPSKENDRVSPAKPKAPGSALAAVAQRSAAPGREPQPGSRAAIAAAEARALQRAAADEATSFREGLREAQKAFLWVTVRAHDGAHWWWLVVAQRNDPPPPLPCFCVLTGYQARTAFAGRGKEAGSVVPSHRWDLGVVALLKSLFPEVLRAGDSVVWEAGQGSGPNPTANQGTMGEFVEYR